MVKISNYLTTHSNIFSHTALKELIFPDHYVFSNKDIIKMRDAIIRKGIPGEDGIIMTTEDAYVPSLFEAIIDNKKSYETRGMWEIKESYMAGPFVNYIVEDEINNRLLVLEGFAYAPSVSKRDYMFELEAIIRSLKIK